MHSTIRKAAAVGICLALAVSACGSDDAKSSSSTTPSTPASGVDTTSADSTSAVSTQDSTSGASTPDASTPDASTPDTAEAATTLPADAYKSGAEVVFRLANDWTDFDVQALPSAANVQLVLPAYDRLVDFDGHTQVPYLADSWEITPTSVTFHIKDGPTCADGTPITASVVENSFKRLIDPATKFSNRSQFFGSGNLTTSSDDATGTFTFTTDTPFSNLIYGFGDPSASIICPAGLADPTKIATEMFGSGPYVLDSATHNDEVVFTLRDDWSWGPYGITSKTPGLPAKITYKIIPDDTTAANLLISGDLDVAKIAGTEVERLKGESSLTYYESALASSALMVFNERPGQILQDQVLRQALATAIDPASWRQTANNGYGTPATSYLSDDAPCFNPKTRDLVPTPDVDAARKVLTDAGWEFKDGKLSKDGKNLALTVLGNIGQNSGPDYLAAQFTELGVEVNLVKVDFATYAANLNATDFTWDITVAQLSSINNFARLPSTFAVPFMSGKSVADGGRNLYNIQDEQVESIIAEANAATGDAACKAWGQLQERYLERFDFLPLGAPVDQWFTSGVSVDPNVMEPLTWRVLAG